MISLDSACLQFEDQTHVSRRRMVRAPVLGVGSLQSSGVWQPPQSQVFVKGPQPTLLVSV